MTVIGSGQVVSGKGAEGVLCSADEIEQVLELMKRPDLDDVILLTKSAAATAVIPLLAKVRGIVCTSGGMTSHLAIVAREFGLPCIVGAELSEPAAADGKRVEFGEDGSIRLAG